MNQNKVILDEIAKGLEMGIQAIDAILPSIENETMRATVEKQKNDYQQVFEQAQNLACGLNDNPNGNVLETVFLKSMIKMKTLLDDSDNHIAEMLIQGSNMLMIDLNRIKNDYTFQDDVAKFIDDILELEQTHVDALKSFL